MTTEEMIALIKTSPDKAWRVRMSKAGIFLAVDGQHHEITFEQAEILWSSMQRGSPLTQPQTGSET